MSAHRPLLSSAKWLALCTLLSRVTGLLRDILLARAFGQGRIADAFNFGFLVPNLFRRLFGEGALNAVFVPTFMQTLTKDGRPAAWRLFARTLTLLTLVLLALIVLIELVLLLIWQFAPAGEPATAANRALVLSLTALMLPFMLSICLLALFSSILNCVGSFVPAALASIVLNLAMIAGILWLGPLVGGTTPEKQVYGVALSVLAAGALQLAFVWPALKANGVPLGWSLAPRDPQVRKILLLMGPVLLGQGALLFSTYLDGQICLLLSAPGNSSTGGFLGWTFTYPLQEGAFTAVTNAQRLYQFPLGVLVISLATVALPAFSRLAATQAWPEWALQVRTMLRLAVFEGLLAGGMILVLAEPIVRLLFEYGRFDAHATRRAAGVLACYGFGMWAFCAQHIVLRGFYSIDDVKTPLRLSCWFIPLNLLLTLALVWFENVREAAFALSSAATGSASVLAGLWLLRRRTNVPLCDRATAAALLKMAALAAACAALTWWLRRHGIAPASAWVASALGSAGFAAVLVPRAMDALGSLALGTGFYMAGAWLLGLPEARRLLWRDGRGEPGTQTQTRGG